MITVDLTTVVELLFLRVVKEVVALIGADVADLLLIKVGVVDFFVPTVLVDDFAGKKVLVYKEGSFNCLY